MPTPFELLGGEARVLALVERFYKIMAEREVPLAKTHRTTVDGQVDAALQHRFARFLVGWLGGPQDYIEKYGNPRLRMRHHRVPIDLAMRDAWLRCMAAAMTELEVTGEVREYLDTRFAEVADFMRNREG